MSFEYVLRVDGGGECSITRERVLSDHEVIESPLGSVVVDQVDQHPGEGTPGRARCHPFTPIHSTEA